MTSETVRPWPGRYTGRSEGISQAGSNMAFVQFTQPDDQPIVINTERIIAAAPAPPDGQGTRITFTNGGHQDERAAAVEHQRVGSRMVSLVNCEPNA